jgi:hypothetical protein
MHYGKPTEYLWANLKGNELANVACEGLGGALLHLAISVLRVLHLVARTPQMTVAIGLFEPFSGLSA